MKINIDIILYELSQNTSCLLCGQIKDDQFFGHAEPLLVGSDVRSDVLYILSAEELNESIGPGAYICTRRPNPLPNQPGVAIITVDDISSTQLFGLVYSVFSKYAEWDTALLDALNDPEPFKAMSKCSKNIFANPIAVYDRDFHVLVPPFELPAEYEEFRLLAADENGFLPLNVVNDFKADAGFNAFGSSREPARCRADYIPNQYILINLFQNDEYVARLVIYEKNTQFRSFDEVLLRHLARFMEACFSFSQIQLMLDMRGLRGTLISLLEGIGERHVTEAELSSRGWASTDRFVWLHLLQTEHDINNKIMKYTCSQIETLFPQTCAVQWSGGISVLADLTAEKRDYEKFFNDFDIFATKGCFRTGLSNVFYGVDLFADYFKQASIAASIGCKTSPDMWLYRFGDFAMPYLLKNGVQNLPPLLCCHPAVRTLFDYDTDNDTEYIETLRKYLDNQMNLIKTSRDLFIHRSTIIYRLRRIKELAGIDWEDRDQMLYLRLSLKILEYSKTAHWND